MRSHAARVLSAMHSRTARALGALRPNATRALVATLCVSAAALVLALAGLPTPRARELAPTMRTCAEHAHPAAVVPAPLVDARAPASRSALETPHDAAAAHAGAAEPSACALRAPAAGRDPVVALDGARLELRVTREGAAEPHAWIELGALAAAPELHRADAAGRLVLERPAGSMRALAWSHDAMASPLERTLRAGEHVALELELVPALALCGRVRDAWSGRPLAGARVSIWTLAAQDAVETDAHGAFLHPRLARDGASHQVRVECLGYGAQVLYVCAREDGSWLAPAIRRGEAALEGSGAPARVDFALEPAVAIAGRVQDACGRAIADVRVRAQGHYQVLPEVAARDAGETRTDEDGNFRIAGLRADVAHVLELKAPGCARLALRTPAERALERELGTLVLEPESVLAGRVLDAHGEPVSGLRLELRPLASAHAQSAEGEANALRRVARRAQAESDELGVFTFDALAAGRYELGARREAALLCTLELELGPAEERAQLELRLPAAQASIAGRVSWRGRGVAGVRVELERAAEDERAEPAGWTISAHDGSFRLPGLEARARYRVRAAAAQGEAAAECVAQLDAAASSALELALGPR